MEGKEWVWNNGILKDSRSRRIKSTRTEEKIKREKIAEVNAKIFESFLKSCNFINSN